MFQGQPKAPKFRVGDTVHLVENSGVKEADVLFGHGKRALTGKQRRDEPTTTANLSGSSAYKVTALHASSTDKEQHEYELTPIEPVKVTTIEANIIPAPFLPGDIVTPLSSAAATEDYYRVTAVTIKEEAAPLASEIGYGATPGRPVLDDGEFEMLENPFAGGFKATRRREAMGTNTGGTQRTSIGKMKPEEKFRIVLSLVDEIGIKCQMEATKVKKVPMGEAVRFAQLEKFLGQD